MIASVAYEPREQEAEEGDDHARVRRAGAQSVMTRGHSADDAGTGERRVSGALVEAHREAAPSRPNQIDLHDHGRRPRKALVDAQERICGDDPPPALRPENEQWNGQRDQPSDQQCGPTSVPIGQPSGREIRERLRKAEDRDERENGSRGGDAELFPGDDRQDRPLETNHRADERVHDDEQRELLPVRSKAERNGCHTPAGKLPRFAARVAAAFGGAGGMSRTIAATNVPSSSIANVLLKRRSNPMVDTGLALNARPQTEPANAPGRMARKSGRVFKP